MYSARGPGPPPGRLGEVAVPVCDGAEGEGDGGGETADDGVDACDTPAQVDGCRPGEMRLVLKRYTFPVPRVRGTLTVISRMTGSVIRWVPGAESSRAGQGQDLRHAHASWLLAGGADLQVVKERLGHASIATTEKYLHSLPAADETALDALTKIRNPSLARPA
jgi:integrase